MSVVSHPVAALRSAALTRVAVWQSHGRDTTAQLAASIGTGILTVACITEISLIEELRLHPETLVVIELGEEATSPAHGIVARVKRQFPTTLIVGYCWLTPKAAMEIVLAVQAGLDALVLRGFDDLGRVVRRLLAANMGVIRRVLHDLETFLSPALMEWAAIVLSRAPSCPNVSQLACLVGCSPRTLQRRAREQGLSGPGELIEAVRTLHAVYLLTMSALSVRDASREAGFSSSRALRDALTRYELPTSARLIGATAYASWRDAIVQSLPTAATGISRPKVIAERSDSEAPVGIPADQHRAVS
jgi:AraC-like DNA-binding protein